MKPERNTEALKLAAKRYLRQLVNDWQVSLPAMLLPGIGNILVFYVPALIIANLLAAFTNQPLVLSKTVPYLWAFGGLWLLGEFIWRLTFHFLNRTDARGMKSLYKKAMEELLAKDLAFFHNNFAGALTKKTIAYGRSYENFVDTLSFSVAGQLLPLAFVIPVLWHFTPWLILILLAMVSLTFVLIYPFIKRRQRLVDSREIASNVMAGHVADVIGNIDAVRAYAHEAEELAIHRELTDDYMGKSLHSWDYHNMHVDVLTSPFYVLTNLVGLIVAITASHGDANSLKAIIVTFSYYATFSRTLWEFNRIYRNIETSLTEAGQFTALLLENPEVIDLPQPKPFKAKRGKVEFRNVNFRYGDTPDALFSSFNLLIQPGEKVALVGHSGGGKTTITKLLLRFMDINSGEILIDNQNIAQVRQNAVRESIAYVPQEPVMFHRSLTDNIRYGKQQASSKEVEAMATLAHAHEFISELQDGYATFVGERGVKLSGGQRQRVAIARAMLKDAPILVLDEATSSLDSESEKYIQDALWKLMEGRTAIVIAHRLSTIQKMDRIIVLDGGQIVEQGSHKDLLRQSGTYAKLWKHQSGGFLDGEDEQ